ncbi:MAG: hypothetical protein AB7F32_05330 [Victivallaceae bacterium]
MSEHEEQALHSFFGLAGAELRLTESPQPLREPPDEAADGKDYRIPRVRRTPARAG